MRHAILLGENHPESHFNLGLIEEQRERLAGAARETLAALRLNREQPDAHNPLGAICAQEVDTVCVSTVTVVMQQAKRDCSSQVAGGL